MSMCALMYETDYRRTKEMKHVCRDIRDENVEMFSSLD